MNPSSSEPQSGLQLPTPVEQATTNVQQAVLGSIPANDDLGPTPNQTAVGSASMPTPLMNPLNSGSQTGQDVILRPGVNSKVAIKRASDSDLIEKDWISRAKAIVSSTRDDPYKQSEALTQLKAEYLQKRYNKVVKLK